MASKHGQSLILSHGSMILLWLVSSEKSRCPRTFASGYFSLSFLMSFMRECFCAVVRLSTEWKPPTQHIFMLSWLCPCVYDGAVGLDDVVVTGRTPSETTFCFRTGMVIYHIFCLLRLGTGSAMHYNIFYLSHLNIHFEVLVECSVCAHIFL